MVPLTRSGDRITVLDGRTSWVEVPFSCRHMPSFAH